MALVLGAKGEVDLGNPVANKLLRTETCICLNTSVSNEEANKLKWVKRVIENGSSNEGLGNCVICADSLLQEDKGKCMDVDALDCGHLYHKKCLDDASNHLLGSIFLTEEKPRNTGFQCFVCKQDTCVFHRYRINVTMLDVINDAIQMRVSGNKKRKRTECSDAVISKYSPPVTRMRSSSSQFTTTPLVRVDSPSPTTINLSVSSVTPRNRNNASYHTPPGVSRQRPPFLEDSTVPPPAPRHQNTRRRRRNVGQNFQAPPFPLFLDMVPSPV